MSSISEEITALKVAAAEQTAASQALAQEVAGKMAQIDAKVEGAQEEFKQFQVNTDANYLSKKTITVTVDGNVDTFYPVFFPLVHSGISRLQIFRDVHMGAQWSGHMVFQLQTCSARSGNSPAVISIDILKQGGHAALTPEHVHKDGFIGRVLAPASLGYGVFVFLRGGYSYNVTNDAANYNHSYVHTSVVTNLNYISPWDRISVLLNGCDITHVSGSVLVTNPATARDESTVPLINYIRGE
ncbi:MAG: hypothetical protein ACRCWB_02180 [Enterovibrio sp.]